MTWLCWSDWLAYSYWWRHCLACWADQQEQFEPSLDDQHLRVFTIVCYGLVLHLFAILVSYHSLFRFIESGWTIPPFHKTLWHAQRRIQKAKLYWKLPNLKPFPLKRNKVWPPPWGGFSRFQSRSQHKKMFNGSLCNVSHHQCLQVTYKTNQFGKSILILHGFASCGWSC